MKKYIFLVIIILSLSLSQNVFSSEKKKTIDGMIMIGAGEFTMGSTQGELDESPIHVVYLDEYWIGKFEVTVADYKEFLLVNDITKPKIWENEAISPKDNYPVVGVRYEDAIQYTKWLSKINGVSYTLPTEAQWEKAARGTDKRKYPWGNMHPRKKIGVANYVSEGDGFTYSAPIGSFKEGASFYGAHDMAGNVLEWCLDWYSSDYYSNSPKKNPLGPKSGNAHIVRGGSWTDHPYSIRTSKRNPFLSGTYRYGLIGLRLVIN